LRITFHKISTYRSVCIYCIQAREFDLIFVSNSTGWGFGMHPGLHDNASAVNNRVFVSTAVFDLGSLDPFKKFQSVLLYAIPFL